MPKTLEAKSQSQTPFTERNGDSHHWLGNPRWSKIPAIPKRQRAQEVISDVDRAKAATLLAEFRKQEEIRAANDITGKRDHLAGLERARQFPAGEELKKEIATCDHAKFLAAEAELLTLTVKATEMVVPALERLIEPYDAELSEFALRREADLNRLDLPLYHDSMRNGLSYRHWTLWNDDACTLLHSCRDVTRNLLQKLVDGAPHHTMHEIRAQYSIVTLQFLFTDEDAAFNWL
jgi:hypothetical protein